MASDTMYDDLPTEDEKPGVFHICRQGMRRDIHAQARTVDMSGVVTEDVVLYDEKCAYTSTMTGSRWDTLASSRNVRRGPVDDCRVCQGVDTGVREALSDIARCSDVKQSQVYSEGFERGVITVESEYSPSILRSTYIPETVNATMTVSQLNIPYYCMFNPNVSFVDIRRTGDEDVYLLTIKETPDIEGWFAEDGS